MDLYPFNVTFLCKRHESSKCLRLQADWLEDVFVSSSPGKALDGKLKDCMLVSLVIINEGNRCICVWRYCMILQDSFPFCLHLLMLIHCLQKLLSH